MDDKDYSVKEWVAKARFPVSETMPRLQVAISHPPSFGNQPASFGNQPGSGVLIKEADERGMLASSP